MQDSELSSVEKANVQAILAWEEANRPLYAGGDNLSEDDIGGIPPANAVEASTEDIFPWSSSVLLEDDDLQYVIDSYTDPLAALGTARNEIYARHGNIFDNSSYKSWFSSIGYPATHKVQDSELSSVERANVDTILAWETSLGG